MTPKYTDILANAFSEARAWKLTTVALAGLCVVLVLGLIAQARNTPAILVPYQFATNQGPMKVSQTGDFASSSPEYLSQVALGDLALILNWQPDDVALQYSRFLNRTTSDLYAKENVNLLGEAKQHRANGESQSFFPETAQVDPKHNQVIVDGFLVRWTGDKEVLRTKQRFTVSYQTQKGSLYVASVDRK